MLLKLSEASRGQKLQPEASHCVETNPIELNQIKASIGLPTGQEVKEIQGWARVDNEELL